MNEFPNALRFLPDWSRSCFVVVEGSVFWSSSIAREISARTQTRQRGQLAAMDFVSVHSAQHAWREITRRPVSGIILELEGMEREAIVLLGRIVRQQISPPICAVHSAAHFSLIPVLCESGVSTLVSRPPIDVSVADWCERVVEYRTTRAVSPSTDRAVLP